MLRPETAQADALNYKKKYQALKKKLRLLVYEQECFVDELKKSQRKLLKVSRDRSFLLDRLLPYEHVEDSSSDSESTASSDSGNERELVKDSSVKRKRPVVNPLPVINAAGSLGIPGFQPPLGGVVGDQSPGLPGRLPKEPPKKKPKVTVRKVASKGLPAKSLVGVNMPMKSPANAGTLAGILEQPISSGMHLGTVHRAALSREEIERHLDLKHSTKPKFLSIDMMPHSLPDDIFSHDNSNQDCAEPTADNIKVEVEDPDLVIDMA